MLNVAIPKPAAFRKWVVEVKDVLNLSSYIWSVKAGVAQNALSKFIKGDQLDLRLETASALVEYAKKAAHDKGVVLPPIPVELHDDPTSACGGGDAK
ncbi:hypothetical protein [Pseudovibrio sp. POLY-S9]|uniref:hypothetical protein n=1 Tax=Pseudovibrio sp. POLY-S9 TaxID=1576596 RepID=UPI00070A103B|nr:hypothetical protein [Pseudovibrio sp. POLY-S9]